jgi:hypothetical protein
VFPVRYELVFYIREESILNPDAHILFCITFRFIFFHLQLFLLVALCLYFAPA